MSFRAMGPFNGLLPVPTGTIVGNMRDPATYPYLRYTQLVPAPEIVFSYYQIDNDDLVRLPSINEFAWAYDDYRPTGKGFQLRGKFVDTRVERWDFPYTLSERTRAAFRRGTGIDQKQLYDQTRGAHAQLHRAARVVRDLAAAAWGANNTADPYQLLGLADPVYFDQSSGEELTPAGNPNPNFQVIKKTLQRVKRRINLATNGALRGNELVWVIPPPMADAVAASGEIVNFLKQSPFGKDLTDPNIVEWNLPSSYAGFRIVVEDTVRVFVHQNADGTVADVTASDQKDYILTGGTSYFVSRPGGLDGVYGGQNYSTVQVYHHNGEARVEAFTDAKHELTEGHIVMEDKVVIPTVVSGFKLTNALSADFE